MTLLGSHIPMRGRHIHKTSSSLFHRGAELDLLPLESRRFRFSMQLYSTSVQVGHVLLYRCGLMLCLRSKIVGCGAASGPYLPDITHCFQ
jgi:hypothetical protein